MPPSESILMMPLLSNAKAMLTGSSIEALRRRLKFASVFYDRVYLEAGAARISAGPGLAMKWRLAPGSEAAAKVRWQTPAQRGAAQRGPFSLYVGQEETPGVAATQMDMVMSSDTTISWEATFEPFRAELHPC